MAGSAFKDPAVVQELSKYTPILVDGDVEKTVTAKYGVHGYPTIVIGDAAGGEVDRLVGYRPTDAFLKEMERIARGENTLPALRKRFEESPDDVDAGIALGARVAGSEPEEAVRLFTSLAEKAKSKDRAVQARIQLEYAAALLGAGRRADAATEAETLVRNYADTPSAGAAAARLGRAFLGLDVVRALTFLDAVRAVATDPKDKAAVEGLTVSVLKGGIAASLKRQAEAAGDDPQALNAVAWTCFEQKMNLRDAVGWARKAVQMSDRDPMILDTLANLLWLTGARAEAVKTEAEAAEKTDGPQKKEFEALVAKWTEGLSSSKAPGSIPATPVEPPAPKPADGAK